VTLTIFWKPIAEEHLAGVWLVAPDRNAVTRDAHELELVLEVFAAAVGEISFDTVRVYTYRSLTVEYEVYESEKQVLIMDVWSTADGRPDVTGN
jgi:hypothetical protein